MATARLRRLTALFTVLGLFLPLAPYALGFPFDYADHGCLLPKHVGGGECIAAGLACLVLAGGLRAASWSGLTEAQRRGTWTAFAPIVLQVVLWPVETPLLPVWYWDRR